MILDALTAVLDELQCVEPAVLSDAQSIVALHRQLDRLQAVTARATGCFDAAGEWQLDQAHTAAAWISARCHQPRSTAKAEVAAARAMRQLPACETAWLAGDIALAHVQVLAQVRSQATEEQLVADEEALVDQAQKLPFHQFKRLVAYWEQHVDPDGEDRRAQHQIDRRRLHLSQSFGDVWFGDLVLDPIAGSIVATELERIADELFRCDWADAKTRLGHEPTLADLPRTPAQRRADALVEMAIRASTAPTDGKRPAPLFTVLVGWETFKGRICELANGTVVNPAALVPWLPEAWAERVVFDGPSRVIDVGVAQRLFTGATRRAVEVRDRECFHELCDAPAPRCQVDHIVPYADGGPTTQENGRLACGFHNRARHQQVPPPKDDP